METTQILKPSEMQKQMMFLAIMTAMQSTADKRKVGCVITKFNDSVIATGFNYNLHNKIAACENSDNETYPHVVHAEESAIFSLFDKMKKNHLQNETLSALKAYVTFSPCINCVKLLVQAGVQELYYLYEHPTDFKQSVKTFHKMNVAVYKFDESIFDNMQQFDKLR